MSLSLNSDGRATLARSYRNLSVREIRAKLEGPLGDAERVTAQAELLRRGADDGGPDTTFATGFAPTSALDIGTVESESAAPAGIASSPGAAKTSRLPWLLFVLLLLAAAGALGWAFQAKLIRL